MGFNYLFIFPPSYVALCCSKAHHRLGSESVSWCLETSLFLKILFTGWSSVPTSFVFLSFMFFPTSFWRQQAAFLGAWCPLLEFISCSVEFIRVQMFFWWISGGENGLPILFLHHLRTAPPTHIFWMLSFKPAFLLSSFTFIKRLFSSFSFSAIRVVSSAYLKLLIFLLAILIPACASSSQAFTLCTLHIS